MAIQTYGITYLHISNLTREGAMSNTLRMSDLRLSNPRLPLVTMVTDLVTMVTDEYWEVSRTDR